MPWFQSRSQTPELMDGDSVGWAERREALGQLPLVNRFLGGSRALVRELKRIVPDLPRDRPIRLLDVGCGSADIPERVLRWAEAAGRAMNAIALDRDPAAIALAADRAVALERRLLLVRGTALRLPFRDQAVDLIAASMFCHHFFAGDLVALMRELTRVARVGVIINDLRRHPLAYWGYRALSRVFLRGHVVRHDGAISVLRGFVPQELAMLGSQFPEFRWSVRRRFAFRICLVGRRIARALT